MILFLCFMAWSEITWTSKIDDIEVSTAQLKKSLQQLQMAMIVTKGENIPVSSILSTAKSINFQIEKPIQKVNKY